MRLLYSILYIFILSTDLFSVTFVPVTSLTPCLQFESSTTVYNSDYIEQYYGTTNYNQSDPQPQDGVVSAVLNADGSFYKFYRYTKTADPSYPYNQYSYSINEVIVTSGALDIALKGSKVPTGSNADKTCNWTDPAQCVEPTTTNIGIYPSQADCTTALQTLSNISSSTSLACGCPTIDVGLTALYADNLVCNQGYYESFVDGKTFCYATPVCSNNQILNDNNSSCRFPNLLETDIGSLQGSIIYRYENGITQVCSTSTSSCNSYDDGGNHIDNIPIDGVTYQTRSDAQTNRLINIGGTILAMTAAGVAILGSGGLLTPAAIATAGTTGITAGLFTAGNAFTESAYTLNSEDHDNISATEKGIRIDLATMDFSDPSNAISSTQNAQGNEVYTIENPDEGTITKIEVTPDKIISTKRDTATNEETIINVNKDVLTNPVTQNDFTSNNNLNNVDYTVTEVTPPKINNDGTTTTSSTQTINKTLNTANCFF